MSPNGSIATVVPFAVARKADCPYHSTGVLLLSAGWPAHLALVVDLLRRLDEG